MYYFSKLEHITHNKAKKKQGSKRSQNKQIRVNPFTAPACKISGLKNAHVYTCKQYTWWSYNKSTVHFGKGPFTCSHEGGKQALMASNVALLLGVFRVTARRAWQWKG